MQEIITEIPIDKKHNYRFIKIYSLNNKDDYFIFTTKSKDVSCAICKLRKKMINDNSRIGSILKDCSYVQIKTGFYTTLESVFERQILQNHYSEIIQKKIDNYVI